MDPITAAALAALERAPADPARAQELVTALDVRAALDGPVIQAGTISGLTFDMNRPSAPDRA